MWHAINGDGCNLIKTNGYKTIFLDVNQCVQNIVQQPTKLGRPIWTFIEHENLQFDDGKYSYQENCYILDLDFITILC